MKTNEKETKVVLTFEEKRADLLKKIARENKRVKKEAVKAVCEASTSISDLVQKTITSKPYVKKSVKVLILEKDGMLQKVLDVQKKEVYINIYDTLKAKQEEDVTVKNACLVLDKFNSLLAVSLLAGLTNDDAIEKCSIKFWQAVCDTPKGFKPVLSNKNIKSILDYIFKSVLGFDVCVKNSDARYFYHTLATKKTNGVHINNKMRYLCDTLQTILINLITEKTYEHSSTNNKQSLTYVKKDKKEDNK